MCQIIPPAKAGDQPTKAEVTFRNVKLPRNTTAKEVEFSAYAFNSDRVKSETARTTFTYKPLVSPTKPKAYVVSVGVNATGVDDWKLSYAVKDAQATRTALSERLSGSYDVVSVELVSDFNPEQGKPAAPRTATKDNFRTVLELIAGVVPDKARLATLKTSIGEKTVAFLSESTPDDAVVISFSSHGYGDQDGNFYLLPDGATKRTTDQKLPDFDSMISSDELSLWLKNVDAAEMVMIIDACHAASSVEGKEFKPGPMGSRGLGQLAYDKRMRILTASQSQEAANEAGGAIGHGLLTYSLIEEGLEKKRADHRDDKKLRQPDGKITMPEWLEFAVEDVPRIYECIQSGRIEVTCPAVKKNLFDRLDKESKTGQLPSLFDFRRLKPGEVETVLALTKP